MAVEATRSALDLAFPAFPETRESAGGAIVEIDIPANVSAPRLVVLQESAGGRRSEVDQAALRPGETNRVVGLRPPAEGRLVLLVRWTDPTGQARIAERVVRGR